MAGTGVGKFSSTASNNTSNLTVNFAENMAPSNVNNAARELMGHMRDMYEQLGDGYFEFGDGDGTYTVARGDADTITITSSADISSVYFAGRKIRITDGGANVVEGTIASSSHSSTTQTVNLTGISLASGTPTKVELGIDTAAFGGRVILDDDGDTYIEAPTDDTIDIYVAGAKDFVITANTFTAESGSTIAAQALTATTGAFTDNVTITTADNTDTLSLISTDADANAGPNLRLYRNSGSPADADTVGVVEFEGRNDNSQDVIYSQMRTVVNDVSDGTEDGQLDIKIINGGALNLIASFKGPETVINDASIDHDFRVESNSSANMLFVDGGENRVGIGTNAPVNTLHVKSTGDPSGDVRLILETNATDGNASIDFYRSDGNIEGNILFDTDDNMLLVTVDSAELMRLKSSSIVFNEGSADIDFRVESNGNANMIFVDAGNDHVNIGTATDLGGTLNVNGPILMAESDTLLLRITSSGSDVKFQNRVSNKDISFEGIDGSSDITALHLDMATAGTATFNDNIVMGTSGKGIHLGVTSATAANLLDDYEEGTYTPTFTVASGSLTVHGSHNTLAYTKIGRVVHVQGEVRFSAVSSPSGNFSISLPFAVADLGEGAARFMSSPIGQSGFGGTPDGTLFAKNTNEGTTTIAIQTSVSSSGNDANVNANQVSTSTEFIFAFTFIAA